ncbi:MAG TPA: hypothetical protein VJL59_25855 [Anaerolineales bacterium]|nr:hypothetical protein [Anaerolineales bacterium]
MPRPLRLLLLAYLALGLLYSLATPPFEASDEVHHYPVVQHIATGHGLPVQQPGVKTAWAQEGSQPPAFYLLSAALTFWIDTSDFDSVHVINPFAKLGIPGTPQNANYTRSPAESLAAPFPPRGTFLAVYLLRLLSLLMGAGTVTFAYLLAATLFPAQAREGQGARDVCLPLLAACLVAFNPMFLFISASVNNDNLVWLEAALSLFLVVHLVRGPSQIIPREIGERWWHAPALGLLLGLAALTKLSGLALIPIAGLALFAQAIRTRQWRRFFSNGVIIAVVVVAVASWWYVRNLTLYGEPLGLTMMMNFLKARQEPLTLSTLLAESRSFWFSYWGLFGAFSVLAPMWVYGFFAVLSGFGAAGIVIRIRALNRLSPRSASNLWHVLSHALLILFIATTLISLFRWNLTSFAMQGRLTFTTLAPVAMYLALGLLAWMPRKHTRLFVGVLVGVLGFIALFTASNAVAAAYLPPPPITDDDLPTDLRLINARIAPGAELVGYTLDSPERLKPGDSLAVTLYWRALAPMTADYNLFLHVLGRGRALAGSVDTWPGGGLRPTSFWNPGDIYPDTYVVQIDSDAATPSALWLDLAMWDSNPAQPLPIATLNGDPIPSVIVAVGLLDSPQPITVTPTHTTGSTLEGGITLLGYDLPSTLNVGEPATLALHWQPSEPIPTDYTVFIHIVDSSGQAVAQADGPPLNGDWPTSAWQVNRAVIDPHSITIPASGDYRILVGLYDPATVIPLIAYRADSSEWPDRAIELTTISVK